MKPMNTTQFITRTALLLAITLVFQALRFFTGGLDLLVSLTIIGTLVNLALYVSAGIVGWRGSVVISILTPVVAALQGHLPHPLLIPFVAAGNVALVLAFELTERGIKSLKGLWIGMALASVVKTAALYCLVVLVFVPMLLPGLGLKSQVAKVLSLSFSWPQLITAILGGAIAIPVIRRLRTALQLGEAVKNT